MKRGYAVYVSSDDPPGDAAALLHRVALQLLRPVLDRAEIDPQLESEDTVAVERLQGLAREQLSGRRWWFARTGVDLNPRIDEDFELMLALSADALLLDGFDHSGRNVYEASDNGELYLELTPAQVDEVKWRLVEADLGPDALVFRKWVR